MSEKNDEKQKELDRREQENKEIKETGEVTLDQNRRNHKIELLTIIGEVEGTMRLLRRARRPSMNMCCQNLR